MTDTQTDAFAEIGDAESFYLISPCIGLGMCRVVRYSKSSVPNISDAQMEYFYNSVEIWENFSTLELVAISLRLDGHFDEPILSIKKDLAHDPNYPMGYFRSSLKKDDFKYLYVLDKGIST